MPNFINILTLVVTVLLTIITITVSCIFYRKANKLQVDISGFIIQEITMKITGNIANYVYPYRGKDGKLHKAVIAAPINITGNGNVSVTGVKNENI